MKNIVSDIMAVNKMIIFLDGLLDESIDFELFMVKIDNDIHFIHKAISEIIEYNLYEADITGDDVSRANKLIFSLLNRFNSLLQDLSQFVGTNDINYDLSSLSALSSDITIKIKLINQARNQKDIKVKSKQYINENEYAILFKSLEET